MPIPELLLRGSVTYLVLYALIRIVGRRESGSVGLTDVLVIVLVADAASTGMAGDSQTLGDGLVLVLIILLWSVIVDALSYYFPWLYRVTKGGPRPLIVSGNLVRKTMRREFMTVEEVESQLRLNGIADITEVERAYLEPNGHVSVVSKQEAEDEAARERDGDGNG